MNHVFLSLQLVKALEICTSILYTSIGNPGRKVAVAANETKLADSANEKELAAGERE